MQFTASGTLVIYIAVYCIIAAFALLVVWEPEDNSYDKWRSNSNPAVGQSRSTRAAAFVILFVISAGVFNVGHYYLSAVTSIDDSTSSLPATPEQKAEVVKSNFGFESGKEYPLEIGAQSISLDANASARSDLFSVSAETSITGSSMFTVAYFYNDHTYTLQLPMTVDVILDNQAPPSMAIELNPDLQETGTIVKRKEVVTWSNCKTVISNLAIACQRTADRVVTETLEPGAAKFSDIVTANLIAPN